MAILIALPFMLLMIFVISLFFSLPTYFLWNWLMPDIFHLTTITWLQAWGLTFLCGILFKSSSASTSESKALVFNDGESDTLPIT